MRRIIFFVLTLLVFLSAATVVVADSEGVVPYDPAVIDKMSVASSDGHTLTSVKTKGDQVVVSLKNVLFTPQGVDTKGEGLERAATLYVFSGLMDAAGIRRPFAAVSVSPQGEAEFSFPNTATRKGVPVVEHLWGRSGPDQRPGFSFALVHDPEDPWVVQGLTNSQPDLNKLAIGVLMCPDGQVKPLKPLGKISQGPHPELASQCQ